jgi:hypothetical protein
MNRVPLYELLERIRGSAGIAQHFLANEDSDARVVAELIGRADIIESKLAELRGRLGEQESERPKHNVHRLGARERDRPKGDGEAA